MLSLIDTLFERKNLENDQLKSLIECKDNSIQEEYLFKQADKKRKQIYGTDIYIRGLIEISNYCKNNCFKTQTGRSQSSFNTGMTCAYNGNIIFTGKILFYRHFFTHFLFNNFC